MNEKNSMIHQKGSLAIFLLIILGLTSTASAGSPREDLMGEGLPYQTVKTEKSYVVKHDIYADREASMGEGIAYADNVIAADAVLIKLNHRQILMDNMGTCVCEDLRPSTQSQLDVYKQKILDTKPAAGVL